MLPLSYLEHLVAKLRSAGLVTSTRGAHGGYSLARPAAEIDMLDVVQALEGPISPMECFHTEREGRVLCSHETDEGRACATKLLWTRVQGGVTKALGGTTVAALVEFTQDNDPNREAATTAV
jgi:Rrf2 family cysteine metabolism transcriptional repressor